MTQQVVKIFGPPGTGKTTRLLKIVEDAMSSGIPPEKIAYMAFTRKAATEASLRAQERFGFGENRLPWFRTLHSMAFAHIHARKDDMMQEEHFQELGRTLGFKFTSLDDEFSLIANGTALGDKTERIQSLSRLRGLTLHEQWMQSSFADVPWLAVEQWAAGLKRYKQSRGMMDFTDLLEQFDAALDVDIFIVDEAQDLSPLQWQVVRRAAAKAHHVYIAGDDDQCIYGWAGADVNHFLRIRATTEILPVSFRLPRAVHKLAEQIVQRIQVRQSKQWRSRDAEGEVHHGVNEAALDFRAGKWLLIARNRSSLRRYEAVLKNQGYPYLKDGRHSTNNTQTRGITAWEHWRSGNPLKPADVKIIAGMLISWYGAEKLEQWRPTQAVFMDDAPLAPAVKKMNWMDALEMKSAHREYIRACKANGESLTAEPRITVATIHGVKGGEADNVVLIPDVSQNPWNQINTDDEQRVLYVAVTRAINTLTVCRAQSWMHYDV